MIDTGTSSASSVTSYLYSNLPSLSVVMAYSVPFILSMTSTFFKALLLLV